MFDFDKKRFCRFLFLQNENGGRSLYGALSLLEKDGLQIVSVSDIKDYKEYEPAIEIKSLAELFILAGNQASD